MKTLKKFDFIICEDLEAYQKIAEALEMRQTFFEDFLAEIAENEKELEKLEEKLNK